MSKLIVEAEMNGIPDCCGLCDPLFRVVCATKHDQTIDKMMLRVGRPSWCPIIGELPEQHGDLIDRDVLLEKAKQEQRFYKDEYDAMESGYLDEEREIVKEAYSIMTDCVSLINNAPTIVPAERSET